MSGIETIIVAAELNGNQCRSSPRDLELGLDLGLEATQDPNKNLGLELVLELKCLGLGGEVLVLVLIVSPRVKSKHFISISRINNDYDNPTLCSPEPI